MRDSNFICLAVFGFIITLDQEGQCLTLLLSPNQVTPMSRNIVFSTKTADSPSSQTLSYRNQFLGQLSLLDKVVSA